MIGTGRYSYMAGKVSIDPLVTHAMPLERINDAFDPMHRGESIRSAVISRERRPRQAEHPSKRRRSRDR